MEGEGSLGAQRVAVGLHGQSQSLKGQRQAITPGGTRGEKRLVTSCKFSFAFCASVEHLDVLTSPAIHSEEPTKREQPFAFSTLSSSECARLLSLLRLSY